MKKTLHIITILFITVLIFNYPNIKVEAETPDISISNKKDVSGAFVVTSDPQYPWTDKTDNGQTESESEKKRRSEEFIREQYNSINEYTSQLTGITETTPVLINGDLTAFGHPWQWDKMKSLLGILNSPIFPGLGNHDIENNLDDCFLNECARQSMNFYLDHVSRLDTTRFDRKQATPSGTSITNYFGSFAYSMDVGPIHFIQLNNDPTQFFSISTNMGIEKYTMENALSWLKLDLEDAKKYGQAIVINMHKPDSWKYGDEEQRTKFKKLLKDYNVKAVFAGHYHKNSGYFPVNYKEFFGDVPVFLSGSASQKTYLTVEYNNNEMKVYKISNNNWKNKVLVKTIDISGRNFPSYKETPELYEHSNGLGRNLMGLPFSEWNDKISSVRVPPHKVVTLYEHTYYKGRKKTLRNNGNLPKLYNLYDFNDITSSYEIHIGIIEAGVTVSESGN
ncbi:metallophosphoesterase [Bacillus wiedmannii]|uniref:metallophosphoesterase n=1 Tax=Bacillus wiedmannii TaxID=1890302 RepID=UPI003CE90F6E